MSNFGSWVLKGYIKDCQKPSLWILWLTSEISKRKELKIKQLGRIGSPTLLPPSKRYIFDWCCLLELFLFANDDNLFWWQCSVGLSDGKGLYQLMLPILLHVVWWKTAYLQSCLIGSWNIVLLVNLLRWVGSFVRELVGMSEVLCSKLLSSQKHLLLPYR